MVINPRSAWTDRGEEAIAFIHEWAAALRSEKKGHRLFSRAYFYLYPRDFWMDVGSLRSRDPSGLENAVVFLEADPWCFHSGYVKAHGLIS